MKKQKEKINEQKHVNKLARFYVTFSTVILSIGVIASAAAAVRQKMIHAEKEKIYSVTFNLEGDNPKGKRGDAAVGMVAGINGEKNDFDNVYPYKAIEEIKDENGDEFVRIPKFYERINYEAGKSLTYSITSAPRKGYNVAPAFIQGDEEIDYIDIGKYEASIDKNGHLTSLPGVMPETTGHTLDQYRTIAEKDGNQLFDWRGNQALQSLFVVEFATLDSQSIMAGETQYVCYYAEITAEQIAAGTLSEMTMEMDESKLIDRGSENAVEKFVKANLKHCDISVSYQDEDEQEVTFEKTVTAKSVTFGDDDEVTIKLEKGLDVSELPEDTGIKVSFGSYNYHKTGSSVGRKGSSNGASQKALEVVAMNYRGVENWYGNTITWCDGLATYQDDEVTYLCVSMDATKNGNRDSYKKFEVEDMSETAEFEDGLFFNHYAMIDEVEYQYDDINFYFNDGDYLIGWVGGDRDDNSNAGVFCVRVYLGVSHAYNSVRLSCISH